MVINTTEVGVSTYRRILWRQKGQVNSGKRLEADEGTEEKETEEGHWGRVGSIGWNKTTGFGLWWPCKDQDGVCGSGRLQTFALSQNDGSEWIRGKARSMESYVFKYGEAYAYQKSKLLVEKEQLNVRGKWNNWWRHVIRTEPREETDWS